MAEHTTWQTFKVKGGELLDTVRDVIQEGNIRRVRIRQHERTIAEFPLTVGVVGAVLAPVLAAIGVLAALITDCEIDVEKVTTDAAAPPATTTNE